MTIAARPTVLSRTVGPFQENSYLLVDPSTLAAVLVDPGAEPDELVRMVRESGATLEAIWLTHAHVDHVGGIAGVRREWPVPVYLHPADRVLYDRAAAQAAFYGIPFEQPDAPDVALAEGDRLMVGSITVDVHHTPGHAPGHVVFVAGGVMLGGDLLFAGSVGRTDLPYCDPAAMTRSLDRVAAMDERLVVYPGHGPATSIGEERRNNPFLSGALRPVGG